MYAGLRVVLQPHEPGLCRGIMGAGQQSREGDHVEVLRPAVEGVQVLGGGGAGGLGGALALPHFPQQVRLIEGGVIDDGRVSHMDGQRHTEETPLSELGGRQIAAAVHDNFEAHTYNLPISFQKSDFR